MQYDLTKPNTGRTFDYWLGGSHNFEIDRQFADNVAKQWPFIRDQVLGERQRIQDFIRYFYDHGIRAIIDFGSGLPTCGNTHIVAHKIDRENRVIYCDIDPITAAYGQEILAGQSNVLFLHGDASKPLAVLDAPETRALLGTDHLVGFNFLSLAHILTDQQLGEAWRTLYDWAAPGSCMAVSVPSKEWETDPYMNQLVQSYRRVNLFSYYRSPAELEKLFAPWKLTAEGIIPCNPSEIPDGDKTKIVRITYSMTLSKE